MSATDWIIASSSTALRLGAYIFLRWIPAHPLPIPLLTTFLVYLISALPRFFQTKPYKIISDQIDIITKETVGRHSDYEDSDEAELDDDTNGEPVEELDVQETIVVKENDPRVWRTLLTGIPSPASLGWTLITSLINLALVLMVADFTFSGRLFHEAHNLSMARVGYVSARTASILVREPKSANYPVTLSVRHADLPYDGYRAFDQAWTDIGTLAYLDNTTDFTGTFTLTRLAPDTRYQYRTSTNHTGFFTTPAPPGQTSRRHDNVFTFLHSSCIKPNFPYKPLRHPLTVQGFTHLAKALPTLGAQFMLFLGDFIYIDVPHRFGSSTAAYRREYRQVYASPQWPSVSSHTSGSSSQQPGGLSNEALPWIHVYDDHEIANDWSSNESHPYPEAADPWNLYQASVNPPAVRAGASYFSFVQGPASFFMLDTRRYRDPSDGSNGSLSHDDDDSVGGTGTGTGGRKMKSMLGEQQREDVLAWLARKEVAGVKWKVLVSSIPFTRNWRVGNEDTWGGFLAERRVLLEAMWDVGASGTGIVILSGDRHEFAATAFPPPQDGVEVGMEVGAVGTSLGLGKRRKRWPASATVHEFSTSPLSMFYLPIRSYWEGSEEPDVLIKYVQAQPSGSSDH